MFDEQYVPTTEKESIATFRHSKLLDSKKSFYQTDFRPISKLSIARNQRKRKKKLRKPNIVSFDENQETSLVYINPVNNDKKFPYQNQLNQPNHEKELSYGWRSELTPFPPEKNPIQVVDREKEFVFEKDFLLADASKIRYKLDYNRIVINFNL